MFPHTVTIYNVSQETDPATFKDVEKTYITVLRGVLLEASKAANVRQSGLEGADAVNLYIPVLYACRRRRDRHREALRRPAGILAGSR